MPLGTVRVSGLPLVSSRVNLLDLPEANIFVTPGKNEYRFPKIHSRFGLGREIRVGMKEKASFLHKSLIHRCAVARNPSELQAHDALQTRVQFIAGPHTNIEIIATTRSIGNYSNVFLRMNGRMVHRFRYAICGNINAIHRGYPQRFMNRYSAGHITCMKGSY